MGIKVKVLLLLSIIISPLIELGASVIQGEVTDARTGESLTGAVIQVKNTTLNTVTDLHGAYTIQCPGRKTYLLHCSFLGYSSVDTFITVNKEIHIINFKLIPTSINLNGIVVTASRAERKLKDVPLITQVVSTKEIEKVGAVNLQEALEMAVPGLEFQQEGYGTNLKMQGLDGKYILVLIDGERMAGETRGNIDYSRLNAANVERIEVVRGASSSLYGSKAIGGVIDIITKDNNQKRTHVTVNSRYSRYNELSSGATIGMGKAGWRSQTDIQYKHSDGYDLEPETPNYKTQYGFDNIHLRQKVGYTVSPSWNLSLMGAYYRHEQNKLIKSLKTHPLNHDYTLGFKSNWYLRDKHSLEFVLHTDQYEIYRKQHISPYDKKLEYRNRIINPRLTGDFKVAQNNQLTFGIEYLNDYLNGICVSGDRNFTEYLENDTTKGVNDENFFLFFQDEHTFFNRLMLTTGLRTEFYKRYNWHFVPAISLKYDATPFIIRGNIGVGYKAPALKELYMDYVVPGMGDIHIVGNPELKPEESLYTSLSGEFVKKNTRVSLILFQNRLNNMIRSYIDPNNTAQMLYENINKANTHGFDVLFESMVFSHVKIGGGYSLNISRDLINDRPLNNVSKHSFRLNSAYTFSKKSGFPVTVNLMCKWFGQKYYWNTRTVAQEKKPAYALWTLSAVGRYKNRLSVIAGVENLFNYIGIDYSTTVHPGIKPFISLSYDFNINSNKNDD